MKQFFQWFENFSGVDANTSATIIITLIVFGIGLWAAKISEGQKQRGSKRNYKESTNQLILDFAQGCKRQSRRVLQTANKSDLLQGSDFVVSIPSIKTLPFFTRIDLQAFINNYSTTKNKKIKLLAISRFFEIIGKVDVMQKESIALSNKLGDIAYNHIREFRAIIQDVVNLHDKVLQKLKNTDIGLLNDDSFSYELIKLFIKWEKSGEGKTLKGLHKNIVMPLQRLSNNYPKDPLILEALCLTNKCHNHYINIEAIQKMLIKNYEKAARVSKKAYLETSIILRIFEEKEKIKNPYSYCRKVYQEIRY